MKHFALLLALFVGFATSALARDLMPLNASPQEMLSPPFVDEAGHKLKLDNFHGKIVLLNVWATWCVPCRTEMPTLDALQAQIGSDQFQVVELSIDEGGFPVIRRFFSEIGITHLKPYLADSLRIFAALAVDGLPTTILIDRQGREIGRLVGPAEWNRPESIAFFEKIIASKEN
ncbi:MAG: TlpA disulfide reductase family protein [Paracoccaceae bacterium]